MLVNLLHSHYIQHVMYVITYPLHAFEDANGTGTYQYILFWIRGGTRNVKIVHTSTYRYVRTHDISMAVHTGMYRYVLFGTRRYEQVQGGT